MVKRFNASVRLPTLPEIGGSILAFSLEWFHMFGMMGGNLGGMVWRVAIWEE